MSILQTGGQDGKGVPRNVGDCKGLPGAFRHAMEAASAGVAENAQGSQEQNEPEPSGST